MGEQASLDTLVLDAMRLTERPSAKPPGGEDRAPHRSSMTNTFQDIEQLEADLWAAADQLRFHPLSLAAMFKTLHPGLFDT